MAIEILERGTLPENDVFDASCNRCKSKVRFLRSDARFTSDQRDGDFLTIDCPVCAYAIHVSARKMPPPSK